MSTNLLYDSDTAYADTICEACLLLLSEAPVIVTLHYPEVEPLHFHRECYESIAAFLPPPAKLTATLQAKRRLRHLQAALRRSSPGGTPLDSPI